MHRIEPDGRDYIITLIYDSNGKLSEVTISATVFIQGSGASDDRAKELTAAAAKEFKTRSVDGVSIGFDVQYKYAPNKTVRDLDKKENLMTFYNRPEPSTSTYESSKIDSAFVTYKGDPQYAGSLSQINKRGEKIRRFCMKLDIF